jgi:hypothetical protein
VKAAEQPTKHWEARDTHSTTSGTTEYKNAGGHSAGWYGATFEDDYPYNGKWEHTFRHESTARTAAVGPNGNEVLQRHIGLHATAFDHGGADALNAVDGDSYFGVAPTPSGDTGTNRGVEFAKWVATYAIGKVNPYIAAGFTAAEVIDILLPEEHLGPEGHYEDRYDYNSNQKDTNHYRWMEFYVDPDTPAQYFIDSFAQDVWTGKDMETSITLEIDGGSDPTDDLTIRPGSTASVGGENVETVHRTDQGTVMYERNDGWTIERIPVSKISERGQQLNWPKNRIEAKLDVNEPVYFAHDAPILRTE